MVDYKFQYCTLWNKKIPGVVLRNVESMAGSVYFGHRVNGIAPEYRLGGSFICNREVNPKDLEKPFRGIEKLVSLEKKYKGALFINVTIPFEDYLLQTQLSLDIAEFHKELEASLSKSRKKHAKSSAKSKKSVCVPGDHPL